VATFRALTSAAPILPWLCWRLPGRDFGAATMLRPAEVRPQRLPALLALAPEARRMASYMVS
jgi:hypothetical protein